jgi:hypothetical protein
MLIRDNKFDEFTLPDKISNTNMTHALARLSACLEYYISEGIVNRATSICSDSRAALLARMSCLPELYYSAEILFRNWICLTEFDWCGSLDTVEMEMTHGNEEPDALARAGSSSAFVGPGVVT